MFQNLLFGKQKSVLEEDESKTSIDQIMYDEAAPIIKKTWKELMRNEIEVGAKIYEHVLTKEISMSVLFINSQMEQQSGLFMQMLNTVVGYVEDPKTFDEKLLELGDIHNKRYGVKPKHYKHFRTAFMKAIKTYIPWNDRRENAWLWFWHRVIQMMSISAHKNEAIVPLDISPEKVNDYVLAIHESFEYAMESPVILGSSFYQALLNEHKEIASLFSKTEFAYQSARFVAMMQHATRLLDDQSTFQNKMRSLSYQHRQYGVQIPQLQTFGTVFTDTLKAMNGDKWKKLHDDAWKWFWDLTIRLFRIGLEQTKYQKNGLIIKYSENYYTSNIDTDHPVRTNINISEESKNIDNISDNNNTISNINDNDNNNNNNSNNNDNNNNNNNINNNNNTGNNNDNVTNNENNKTKNASV